jgi:hypothetical protein
VDGERVAVFASAPGLRILSVRRMGLTHSTHNAKRYSLRILIDYPLEDGGKIVEEVE